MTKTEGCYGYSKDGFKDHIDCIKNSWPYQLLTDNEKLNLLEMLNSIHINLKDLEYEQAWDLGGSIWGNFLKTLGYNNGKFGDREGPKKKITLYKIVQDVDGRIKVEEEK